MPKEFDFEPMPKRQQNIYIIQDSNGDDKDVINYIKSLITQLRYEAQCHLDVAFNVYLTVYLNTNIWGQSDRFTLEPENVTIYPTLPSVCRHEMSVWDNLSKTISSTIKNDHSKGLTSYLPIFIFFVNQNDCLAFAKYGAHALSNNPYFRCSLSAHRRIIFCDDSIWDDIFQIDPNGVPYKADLIFPYRLFSKRVIDYFMQVPQKMYQSGELALELIALHNADASTNINTVDTNVYGNQSYSQNDLSVE